MKNFLLTATLMFAFVFSSLATSPITPLPVNLTPIAFTNWDKLGQKDISFKLEKDVIQVGLVEGLFTAIKLRVSGNDIDLHRLVIKYKNGTKQNVRVRKNIAAGGQSREIQLKGAPHRVIKEIVLFYEKDSRARNAKIEVWGKHN